MNAAHRSPVPITEPTPADRRASRGDILVKLLLTLFVVLPIAASGCAIGTGASPAPTSIQIDSSRYPEAFDAVVELARARGFEPALRNRRSGIMETGPRRAPTVGEFWDQEDSTFAGRMAATAQHLQRRLRFEFVPAGPGAPQTSADPHDLPGPDLLGFSDALTDLSMWSGPIELRIWAWIERPHVFGQRRHPWSLSISRVSRGGGLIDAPWAWDQTVEGPVSPRQPVSVLEVIGRDPAYEQAMQRALTRAIAPM